MALPLVHGCVVDSVLRKTVARPARVCACATATSPRPRKTWTQLAYSTNKARSEELSTKAPYKRSRQDGKRCIIPT